MAIWPVGDLVALAAAATLQATIEGAAPPAKAFRAFAAHIATIAGVILDLLQELTLDWHLRVRSNRDRRCDLWTDRQSGRQRQSAADSDFAKHLVLHFRPFDLGSVSIDT